MRWGFKSTMSSSRSSRGASSCQAKSWGHLRILSRSRAQPSGVGAARHAMRVAENASLVLGVPVEATPDVLEKLSQSEEDLAPAVGF